VTRFQELTNVKKFVLFLACCLVFFLGFAYLSGRAVAEQESHITQPGVPRLSEDATSAGSGLAALGEEEIEKKLMERVEALKLQNAAEPLELDTYGGWKNAPESLGTPQPGSFFRVAKLGGAWWFVTPEGHPFVSKGVTDVNWLGATLSPGPFHDILVQKYGDEETWASAAQDRMRNWAFNTIGPWSSASMAARMPHSFIILDMASGISPRYPNSEVTDYWDPAFAVHAATMARERATAYVEDKNLIGYFLDNEIVWGADHFRTNMTLIQLYMSFPAEAPGRAEVLRFLRASSGTLEDFNAAWGTTISDWSALSDMSLRDLKPRSEAAHAVTRDFTISVFRKYADIAIGALRAVDPNHLILGCRFHNYPGDALVKVAAEYFDVISMAFYESRPPVKEIDAVYSQVDKPFLIEEWTFKSKDSGIYNPFGIYAPEVRTQSERSLAYAEYVENFMRRPYGIGFHWYKWMNNPVLPGKRFSGDNCGLITQDDEPYLPFLDFVSQVNRRVEFWHARGPE